MPNNIIMALDMTEGEQISFVMRHYTNIARIDNPSEKVQLAAAKRYGVSAIMGYIKNHCMKIQQMAVTENGNNIRYIENPSEEIQLLAINDTVHSLLFIDNPTEHIQLMVLTRFFRFHDYIMDLGEKSEWFQKEVNKLKLLKGPLYE